MSANSFGSRLVLTTFGESHGTALGMVLDGVPAGIPWDGGLLDALMARRRPGQSAIVSGRAEADKVELLSGVYEGRTLGTPIAMLVRNVDARSGDYAGLSARAGHADDVWLAKFGHSDPRGGGRTSGRETVSRVMGGAVALMILRALAPAVRVVGFASAIGPFELGVGDGDWLAPAGGGSAAGAGASSGGAPPGEFPDEFPADAFVARFPSAAQGPAVEKLLLDAKRDGLSYGGVAEIWVDGLPAGLGQPVFHKIKSDLAAACMSVGATAGFEIGSGFASAATEGSAFHSGDADYGGVRGGITTGARLSFRCGFKPTSSVLDVAKKGRHDPCIVPRAIPVLEAMTALVIADHLLWARGDR